MPERVHRVTVRLTDKEYTRLLAKMNEVGVGTGSTTFTVAEERESR